MEITRAGALAIVTLPFVAPVPSGHDVLVVDLELSGGHWYTPSEACAIVDQTTGTVYADLTYWSTLKHRGWPSEPPATDPVGALGPGWRATRSLTGRSRGALVSTKDSGDTNHACTVLYLAPSESDASYRG